MGSNEGNRLQILQLAIDSIYKEVGDIHQIARIYETPAWGFDGHSFLNTCIEIGSRFSPDVVLEKLLNIETELGINTDVTTGTGNNTCTSTRSNTSASTNTNTSTSNNTNINNITSTGTRSQRIL